MILMGDPLEPLPETIRLARQTVRVIRQNILVFAFGLNGLAVVLAGLRVLGPVAAAIFHQIGSLLVLLNAIRLLGFERWGELGAVRAAGRVVDGLPALPAVGRLATGPGPTAAGSLRRAGGAGGPGLPRLGDHGDRPRAGGRAPALGTLPGRRCSSPGLHVRLPVPVRDGDEGRARPGARGPGRPGRVAVGERRAGRLERHATGPGATSRRCSSPATRTSSSWPAWSSTATPRRRWPTSSSAWPAVEPSVAAAAEGVFREAVGRTPLEAILVGGRREFEAEVAPTAPGAARRDGPAGRDRPGPGGRRPPAARGRAGLPRRLGGRLRRRALPQRRRGVSPPSSTGRPWPRRRPGATRPATRVAPAPEPAPRGTGSPSSPASRPTPRGPT